MKKVELERQLKRAIQLAGSLYYQLCEESDYPVSRELAQQRM